MARVNRMGAKIKKGWKTMLEGFYTLLPRRTRIHYMAKGRLEDVFLGYRCKDCPFFTKVAGEMLHHQTQWHPWWTWWRRLKES